MGADTTAPAPGLTPEEAAERLRQAGPNVLPTARRPRVWRLLVRQLTHFFALLLWVAAILAVVAGMPALGVAIVIVVLVNGVFAVAQEYRADRAADRLRDLLPVRATVRRGGRRYTVPGAELVPGDRVVLEAGDRISADLHVVSASGLAVDESTLTGESVPRQVGVGDQLYAGTFVVEGAAEADVTATGTRTRLAGIAALTGQVRRRRGPLEVRLNRLAGILAGVAAAVGVAFFGLAVLLGTAVVPAFLLALGVTVALIPEGLLPTVTLALAWGSRRMADRHALVRRLEAVETLGSVTFICTDKTGTLTRNEMAVVEVWTPVGRAEVRGEGYESTGQVAAEAVAACRDAGIRLALVTGDHAGTARVIASQVGLLGAEPLVLNAADLPTDETELGELLDRDGVVVARVAPEDKLRITRALQRRGHAVAMTGDGVNDAPALREADIGVAMGATGSDVAREAGDLVLLDDRLATIVEAVRLGRATFTNIRRFLTYHLTDNVAELAPFVVWGLTGGTFPLALGVLQILALDIGTDLLPALALGAEPPRAGPLTRTASTGGLIDRRVLRRAFGVLGPTEVVVSLGAFTVVLLAGGWRWGTEPGAELLATASGTAFTAIVLGQLANAFACRSETRPGFRLDPRTNRLLLFAVSVELVLLLVFLTVPPLPELLDGTLPTGLGWALAVLAVPTVLLVDAADKARRARRGATGDGRGSAGDQRRTPAGATRPA